MVLVPCSGENTYFEVGNLGGQQSHFFLCDCQFDFIDAGSAAESKSVMKDVCCQNVPWKVCAVAVNVASLKPHATGQQRPQCTSSMVMIVALYFHGSGVRGRP